MATVTFRGDAAAVAQVTTVTIGVYDAATIYSIQINNKVISILGTGGTNATTAVALQTLLAASEFVEFTEVTWTVSSNVVTGTAVTAGASFTLGTAVSGGTGTISNSTTTASAGPNDWSTAANWSTGSVPANGDDVYLDLSGVDLSYGLDQSSVTLNSLTITSSYTAKLGLPAWNGSYYEYRPTYLQIGATTVTIGLGSGSGSGRLKIDFGSVQTAVNCYGTASPADTDQQALLLKGMHAGNVLNAYDGSIGIAVEPGTVSTFATITVAYETQIQSDVNLICGSGCTLTTIAKYGGQLVLNSDVTTLTQTAGYTTIYGTGACTTLTVDGGTVAWESSGTITTGTLANGAVLDFGKSALSRTVTNCTLATGTSLLDPFTTVTFSNPVSLSQCGIEDVNITRGKNISISP